MDQQYYQQYYQQLAGQAQGWAGDLVINPAYSNNKEKRNPKVGDKVLVTRHKEGTIIALSWNKWGEISRAKIKYSGFFYGTSWEDINYLDYLEPHITEKHDLQAGNKD